MSIRQLKLPADLIRITEIAAETWNYPHHPEWNVQPDEEESLADSMGNYQRIWPFIRVIQFFSPGLRDFLQGHVWEEDGQIAGFTQINRRGSTDTWYISAVGVHPNFRRRGIAQRLVEEAVNYVRQRNGKRLLLDVIEGNVPAINLYNKLGFENYTSNFQLEIKPQSTPSKPSLPEDFTLEDTDDYTWRPRYELMKRITPEELTRYEPVEEGRYKKPFLTRLLFPIIKRAEGLDVNRFFINSIDRQKVAYAIYDTRTRATGRNSIMVDLDPKFPELAPYLVNYLLYKVISVNPERVIELNVPAWQEALFDAADEAGFEVRAKLLTLGILLNG
jgi:ribosomal protein S18 acetylase RimI-like enzyme